MHNLGDYLGDANPIAAAAATFSAPPLASVGGRGNCRIENRSWRDYRAHIRPLVPAIGMDSPFARPRCSKLAVGLVLGAGLSLRGISLRA
jgi:hypothetical protein